MNYDLRTGENLFYNSLDELTNFVLKEGAKRFDDLPINKKEEQSNAKNQLDLILDLLIIGTLWNEYKNRKWKKGYLFSPLFNLLNYFRVRSKLLKPFWSWLFGIITELVLDTKRKKTSELTYSNFKYLTGWLCSTGEYKQELKRINKYIKRWNTLEKIEFQETFKPIVEFSEWFYKACRFYLGDYTINVHGFIKQNQKKYRYKENLFFCMRTEAIYFLNMVGAEIINRQMASDFMKTQKQILLLPICMQQNNKCNAILKGDNIFCPQCEFDCNIGNVNSILETQNAELVIIRDLKSFSSFIKPYKNQTHTGIIGVACILNQLEGGLELQNMNIPSQFVFLDFAGCSKNWHQKTIPTSINNARLKKILSKESTIEEKTINL